MSEDRLICPKDAAARLGIARPTIYGWLREGKIEGVRVGPHTVRIRESVVKEKMKERK